MAGTTVVRTGATPMGSIEREAAAQVNNIVDDLEALRGALSAGGVVAVTELMADHATTKTAVDETKTLIDELHDDHATFKTVVDDLKALANLLRTNLMGDGLLSIGTLLISATAEDFKTTTTAYYRIDGIQYSKAATDNLSFSAADTVNTGASAGSFWGIWLVQVNAAGTVSTKSPAADQVYASEAAAIAALPTVDADNVALGYITVQSNDTDAWVANTDDLTPTSDCLDANFTDATPLAFTAAAVSTSAPATLAAGKPTAGPATLAAAVPSSTAVDAVGDMTAAKIEDASGEVA